MFNFIKKTFEGLNKTRKNIVNTFSKFHGKSYLNNNEIDELESVLYQSDLSYELVDLIIENFKNKTLLNDETWEDKFYSILINELNVPSLSNEVDNSIILIVGVNGTGKTTTSAKLANYYKNMGNKVFLVGADTYRAAAVEQLRIWSEKLNVRYISNSATNDPASIVYDGINAGIKDNADKIIIDTAGRLHNSVNLMEELKKIHKIALKFDKKMKITLVVDSNVGQNGMNQALEFSKFIPLNSLILTKMDGTAKGGIAVSMMNKLQLPIEFMGIGEKIDDLIPFDLDTFIKGLVKDE